MKLVEQAFDVRMEKFDNVVKMKGYSKEESKKIENGFLDFVYIDSNHKYENILEDIKTWLPKIQSNGMIGGHDYGYLDGIMKAVDEIFGKENVETFEDMSWLVRLEKIR